MKTAIQALKLAISSKHLDLNFLKFNLQESSQSDILELEQEIYDLENTIEFLEKYI